MSLNSQSITLFYCHAAACLPDNLQKVIELWIVLEQNIIDTAVNEGRNHLCACGHVMGGHFEHFYCRQLKNRQMCLMSYFD